MKSLEKQIKNLQTKLIVQEEIIMTRAQTAEFLSVSHTTLRDWTESGLLIRKRIGGRVYYLKSDIINCLNQQ